MKLFIAGLSTETNSFSPIPTGFETFNERIVAHGNATALPQQPFSAPLHIWRERATTAGHAVVESLTANAQPAGPTVGSVYERFRDEILSDLRLALPVDVILLALHGAMIADGYDDCEGDLMERMRRVAGPETVIGGLLDPHSHLTDAMLTAATLLVAFKEYPHVDIPNRADELYDLAIQAARSETRPVMRDYDCRMISSYRTTVEPIRGFVDRMVELEGTEKILSVSLIHGFPWGDTERTGTRTLVVADGDAEAASGVARRLGEELFAMRNSIQNAYPSIEEALDEVQSQLAVGQSVDQVSRGQDVPLSGPFVLADMSDNAGGGAPGDSTFLLRAILERGIPDVAVGIFWDPLALRFCTEAGEGATLSLRLGGKCGPVSGDPLDLTVIVMRLAQGFTQKYGVIPSPLGASAWVRIVDGPDRVDVVLNDVRTQTYHPEAFTQHGIDLASKRVVAVKSTQHFYAGFAPIARKVIHVATPGTIVPDFSTIPYQKRTAPYWPKIDDPFS